jgi:inorganic triphosphatase YgiF
MKSHPHAPELQEIELKLSLPGANSADLAKRLAKLPLLARRKATRQSLHNIYFDTPDQELRQKRAALRLRRVASAAGPQWLQTLKIGGSDESALSRRGEWESAVPDAALVPVALKSTPWADIDPSGCLFDGLEPCFVTDFERTSWLLRRSDGSVVEVALDIGQIKANGRQAPICELELELKAGRVGALFEVALQIASSVAVLPATQSKAERGYLLAQGSLHQPLRAQPSHLGHRPSQSKLAQRVLREMFAQFTGNLDALRSSDDPELVHQARVGWRRFKSAWRLFRKVQTLAPIPDCLELQPSLSFLGELRNLEVALTETLPALAAGYCQDDAQRAESWQVMLVALTQAAAVQRKAVRYALQVPDVGANLLLITQWLENLTLAESDNAGREKRRVLRDWAKQRLMRLQQRLESSHNLATTLEQQHRVRIHAKRLRYAAQALHDLLPVRLAAACEQQAVTVQSSIGTKRDLAQVSALVATLGVNPEIVAFLRGVDWGARMADGFNPTPPPTSV